MERLGGRVIALARPRGVEAEPLRVGEHRDRAVHLRADRLPGAQIERDPQPHVSLPSALA
jgi:hypothetical protein